MKKSILVGIAVLWAVILAGCNWKNIRDVDYDLSTEIWREMHCYAQFQKNVKANKYWAEWTNEVNNWFGAIVEWKVKADDEEYNLVCNYSDDLWDWTINYTPVNEPEKWNPASEYCINNWWSFEIISNETDIYWECTLPDWTKCEEWAYYNGECWAWIDEKFQSPDFDLETPEGRQVACEERVGYYLNYNEGWASFIRNWHVTYLKRWENAEDDVECVVDMVDKSVSVEFSNHIYNGELQEDSEVAEVVKEE